MPRRAPLTALSIQITINALTARDITVLSAKTSFHLQGVNIHYKQVFQDHLLIRSTLLYTKTVSSWKQSCPVYPFHWNL